MRFILRKDVPTLVKGETGICIDSFSIITRSQFEGLQEQSLKNLNTLPITLLEEIRNFLNEAYADIKGLFIVKFIVGVVETPVAVANNTKVATQTIPARSGYTSAWQLSGTDYDFDSLVTSNISLLAHYTVITYDITYALDGGTNDPTNPATYNIETPTIALADPTKAGFIFEGWTEGSSIPLGSTGDKTFTATWTEE